MSRHRSVVFLAILFGTVYLVANDSNITSAAQDGFDLLITNAKVFDGTGNPWFIGDVGIVRDSIAAIGSLKGKPAATTIDAKGMVVSPGFIDIHSHSDNSFDSPESSANLSILTQGVTTVVTGNDGGGSFEIAKTKATWEKLGIGTNTLLLVPHGTVRDSVTGGEPRAVTTEELEKMKLIVRQAMEEGAWGLSTGLQYRPGRYADTEEIVALGKVVAEYGGVYTSHQRHEGRFMVEATQETIRIGKEAGLPANVTHIKAGGKNTAWGLMKEAVKVINKARAEGLSITADMYSYAEAGGGSLSSVFNIPQDMEPLAKLNKALRDRALPDEERESLRKRYNDELVKALSDPTRRERIRNLTAEGCPECPNYVMMFYWDSLCITRSRKNTQLLGKTLAEAADDRKREQVLKSLFWSVSPPVDPFDVAADLYIEEGEDLHVSGDWMSEDDMREVMKEPWLMFASDGSGQPLVPKRPVHPRNYGNFTRVLRKYVREEKVITLEDAIRKMSSLPASFIGLKDRGLLLEGYKADLVIFDPERVEDKATFENPHQHSTGIEHVIISGKLSIENGKYNGALNGKVLLSTENK
jgi:N-acyl-D-amino-acid deacylase